MSQHPLYFICTWSRRTLVPFGTEIPSHRMYLLISFREPTFPKNRQLIVCFYQLKYQVDGFVGDFPKIIDKYILWEGCGQRDSARIANTLFNSKRCFVCLYTHIHACIYDKCVSYTHSQFQTLCRVRRNLMSLITDKVAGNENGQ